MSMADVPFRRMKGSSSRGGIEPQLSQWPCWPRLTELSLQPCGGTTVGYPWLPSAVAKGRVSFRQTLWLRFCLRRKLRPLFVPDSRAVSSEMPDHWAPNGFFFNSEGSLNIVLYCILVTKPSIKTTVYYGPDLVQVSFLLNIISSTKFLYLVVEWFRECLSH